MSTPDFPSGTILGYPRIGRRRELKRAVAIFADIGVEGGSVQTEIWRLSEWVDHSGAEAARNEATRNDPGTLLRENVDVSNGPGDRRRR